MTTAAPRLQSTAQDENSPARYRPGDWYAPTEGQNISSLRPQQAVRSLIPQRHSTSTPARLWPSTIPFYFAQRTASWKYYLELPIFRSINIFVLFLCSLSVWGLFVFKGTATIEKVWGSALRRGQGYETGLQTNLEATDPAQPIILFSVEPNRLKPRAAISQTKSFNSCQYQTALYSRKPELSWYRAHTCPTIPQTSSLLPFLKMGMKTMHGLTQYQHEIHLPPGNTLKKEKEPQNK